MYLDRLDVLIPASAAVFAKADAASQQRVHILLVADDQIFPESCLGRLQADADIATEWADAVHQEYHVASPDKTAVLLVGAAAHPDVYNRCPVMLSRSPVPCALKKKWVGIIWDHLLSFQPFQVERMGAARGAFKPLAGLAEALARSESLLRRPRGSCERRRPISQRPISPTRASQTRRPTPVPPPCIRRTADSLWTRQAAVFVGGVM